MNPRWLKFDVRVWAALALTLVSLVGCGEKPVVATLGETVVSGGVEFTVGDYEVKRLEVSEGSTTYEYASPVLVFPVTVKNVGEGEVVYSPSHSAQQQNEATTPLLYQDPGAEAELPPASKVPISGIYLEKGSPAGQVGAAKTLGKGDAVEDVLLFAVPESATSLVLSLPPSMHRGKTPVLFRVKFEPKPVEGPKVYSVGEPVAFDGVSLQVSGGTTAYVKIKDTVQGEGYSSTPLYRVDYEITNSSKEVVEYEPGHKVVGGRGIALYDGEGAYKRAKFAGTTEVVDQRTGSVKVEPGKSVKDFVLFEQPDEGAKAVVMEFPGALVERSGIARVKLDYAHTTPAKPKELGKK